MTDKYKEELLRYLTGNYLETTPIDKKSISADSGNVSNGLDTYLSSELGTYTIIGTLQSESYDKYILYGTYVHSSRNFGFLLKTDKNYNHIELITEYDSGTKLQQFYRLEVDEKNQIYGVDYNNDTSKQRLILLNNVFSNSNVRLRQSYNLNDDLQGMKGFQVAKNPTQAEYVIAGTIFAGNVDQPRIGRFQINVGSTNTWTIYYYADTLLGAEGNLSNIYCVWGDNFDFRIVAYSGYQVLVYYYGGYDNIEHQELIFVNLYDIGSTWTSTNVYTLTSIVQDLNTIYYAVHATADGQEVLNLYLISDEEQTMIASNLLSGYTSNTIIDYKMKIIKGVLTYFLILPTQEGQSGNYDISYGFYKTQPNLNEISTELTDISLSSPLYEIINTFNLYQFNIQNGDTLYYGKELFNMNINFYDAYSDGYSISPTDMKPITMSLYDENKLLFNRNLYNLVVYSSSATSTVEVPNTMLNDSTINQELLIGNYYLNISDNSEEIETNEYETLHINTINTLSMKNVDTNKLFPNGSARLNNSVNMSQDYSNAKCGKIRINYSDNTQLILNVSFYPLKNYFYTKFNLYIGKEILGIDFISEDENTIYNTIHPTLEIGKTYSITEDVYIDEKIPAETVLYNGVQVQYDNEDLYY